MRGGGRPTSCTPSSVSIFDARADDLEQPRHDVDLDVELAQRPKQLERLLVDSVREGDDHPLDVEQRDELRELVGPPSSATCSTSASRLRLLVDEADQVDAVLRVLQDLAREHWPTSPAPTMTHVLDVREAAPAHVRGRPSGPMVTKTIANAHRHRLRQVGVRDADAASRRRRGARCRP